MQKCSLTDFACLVCLACVCAWGASAAENDAGPAAAADHPRFQHPRVSPEALDADLARFSSMLAGQFNNYRKVTAARETGDTGLMRTHYIYGRMNMPAFGDQVLYVQQHFGAGDDPGRIYRQRIYASHADYSRSEIVTRIYSFKGEGAVEAVDAHLRPDSLRRLTPEDMTVLPEGCEIFWYRDGDRFVGYQHPGDCVMEMPGTDDMSLLLSDDLILTEMTFSTFTRGENMAGIKLFGDDAPHLRNKARPWACRAGDADFTLHDEGGEAALPSRGKERRETYTLRLLATEPWGNNFVLTRLVEGADPVTASASGQAPVFEMRGIGRIECSISQ